MRAMGRDPMPNCWNGSLSATSQTRMAAATSEAEARLRDGPRLQEAGRSVEAEAQLRRAQVSFTSVRANRRLAAIYRWKS
jgi:hypothetical protein